MKIFDTHTHLNVEQFSQDLDQVIQRAHQLEVSDFAVVGFDQKTIEKALQLSQDYPEIYAIIGWHPTEAATYTKAVEDQLIKDLSLPKVVAMGEMGLDYYWDTATPKEQERVFRRQIAIARELKLPISIHNRDATEDVYRILKDEKIHDIGGIMHSYGGDVDYMKRFLDLGMHISFSGVTTFKKSEQVRQAAKEVPKDRYLVETDAPYLAPVPYRGKRNEPGYTRYVVDTLAQVRQETPEQVAQETWDNAARLFRLETS